MAFSMHQLKRYRRRCQRLQLKHVFSFVICMLMSSMLFHLSSKSFVLTKSDGGELAANALNHAADTQIIVDQKMQKAEIEILRAKLSAAEASKAAAEEAKRVSDAAVKAETTALRQVHAEEMRLIKATVHGAVMELSNANKSAKQQAEKVRHVTPAEADAALERHLAYKRRVYYSRRSRARPAQKRAMLDPPQLELSTPAEIAAGKMSCKARKRLYASDNHGWRTSCFNITRCDGSKLRVYVYPERYARSELYNNTYMSTKILPCTAQEKLAKRCLTWVQR